MKPEHSFVLKGTLFHVKGYNFIAFILEQKLKKKFGTS